MARCFWTLALCLITASAFAQAPRQDDDGNPNGRSRMRRGQDAQSDQDNGGRGDRGGRGRGERGGPDGGGPGGSFFRRTNPMFQALDANEDGAIDMKELAQAAKVLKKLDTNGDNKITADEVAPQGGMFGDPQQMVDRMFQENDKDGDGLLSKEEIPQNGFVSRMLENADKDGDGKISKEEVTAAQEELRNRMRQGGGRFGGGAGGPGGPGSAQQMIQQMDRNGDGKLSPQEVPEQMRRMLQGGDANNDGMIDQAELDAAGQRFRQQYGGGYGRNRGSDRGGDQGQGAPNGNNNTRRGRPEAEQ